jgi:hypothetical protein
MPFAQSAPAKPLSWIVLAALAAGLLLFAACNGGDDENGSGDVTPSPGTDDGTPTPVISVDGEAGSFEQLAAEYVNGVDGVVQYAVDSENFGFHPRGVWTTYRMGEDIREDWTTNNFGYDETTTAYRTSAGMTVCSATVVSISCVPAANLKELEVVLLLFTPIKDLPTALLSGEGPGYEVEELGEETIADTDAQCFDVAVDGRIGDGPPGTEQIKMCFSDDGALLSYDRVVTFESPSFEAARLTATAQEVREATDADFDPQQQQALPSATQPAGG